MARVPSRFSLNGIAALASTGWLVREALRALRPPLELRDKVVVILGGSRGLGLELARQLGARGAKVAICGREALTLQRAHSDLTQRGTEAFARTCDIRDRGQVESFLEEVRRRFGPVDVLVNNAGTIQVGPIEDITVEDHEDAMRTHYFGPLYAISAVLPRMRSRGEGMIVNISSIGGKVPVPHLAPYTGSKYALVGLSEALHAELAKDGIRVLTICPGLMRTGSPRNAWFKGQHRAEYAWFVLGDSLPGTSLSARRAARRIVRAMRRPAGVSELVLGLPAKVAARVTGLFPNFAGALLSAVAILLPEPGGVGTRLVPGRESEGRTSRSWLTSLTRRAERELNQRPAPA